MSNPRLGAFDLEAIKPPRGEMDGSGKFSPNLYRWVRSKWGARFSGHGLEVPLSVFRSAEGTLYIGHMADDGWFSGTRLFAVFCYGPKAEIWAYMPKDTKSFREIKTFWERYRKLGRCAADPKHNAFWSHEDSRWNVSRNNRSCRWCGRFKQRLQIKTVVRRERQEKWVPA